jgi:O-antigen ligase
MHSGHILGAALAILLPLSVFSPKAIVSVFIVSSIVIYFFEFRQTRGWPFLPTPLLGLLGGILLLGGISLLWSLSKVDAFGKFGQLVGLFSAGLFLSSSIIHLSRQQRHSVENGLLAGLALTLSLIAIEIIGNAPLAKMINSQAFYGQTREAFAFYGMWFLKNSATLLAIFVWPCVAMLAQRFGLLAAFGGLLIVGMEVYFVRSSTSILAFAAGVCVFLPSLRWPRKIVTAMTFGAVLVIMTMPLLPRLLQYSDRLSKTTIEHTNSLHHRLTIWSFVAEKIAEKPILGWGLDSSRHIPGGKEVSPVFHDMPDGTKFILSSEEKLPLHPHNGFLQLWLELGAFGAILGAALVAYVIRKAGAVTQPGLPRAATLAAISSTLVVLSLSYGLWQSWWISALWLLVATLIAITGQAKKEVSS